MVKQTETHDIYVMPENYGAETDEDSAEEESVHVSDLPGTQLTAFAVLGSSESQDDADENVERQTSQKKKIITQKMESTGSPRKDKSSMLPK